jgi:hypothetical protein
VCDIFEDLRADKLTVDVKDGKAINVDLKHVLALYKAPLLCLKACSFADVSYNLGLFFFALFSFSAVLVIY